jgi:CubicO group peptidase (beta-lactamase class C family)
MLEFLASLRKAAGPHGGPFRYLSPNSDVLGLVTERASGERYADLLRDRLWRLIGGRGPCLATVDAEGTARAAGGVSITARDLARVGEMMRNGGMGGSRPVVSERWVRDTVTGGDAAAWQAGDFVHLLPQGRYRNKWYQTGDSAFCAIGIHGQWLYVEPVRRVVIVKQSSQHEPVDDALDRDCLAFLRQIARIL